MTLDDRAIEAFRALSTVLESYQDVFGPDEEELEGEDREKVKLTEWVVVTNWVNLEDGSHIFEVNYAEQMLLSHVVGLLTVGLEDVY